MSLRLSSVTHSLKENAFIAFPPSISSVRCFNDDAMSDAFCKAFSFCLNFTIFAFALLRPTKPPLLSSSFLLRLELGIDGGED